VIPAINGIVESSLYVSDLRRSIRFYEETLGFKLISDFGERGCAMHAGGNQVLLLFKKHGSVDFEFPHDGEGELHVAFAVSAAELPRWEAWLESRGVPVGRKTWGGDSQSLYFRDPDRHLLELVTPGTWSVY
jgi:catechol 2,3-dioxygenase-like lactoylglutathione lyase family enzyme